MHPASPIRIRARVSDNPAAGDVDLYLWVEKDGMLHQVKLTIDWDNPINPALDGTVLESSFTVDRAAAAGLLDDLMTAGVRPTKGRDVTKEMESKDAHILFAQRTVEGLIACLQSHSRT